MRYPSCVYSRLLILIAAFCWTAGLAQAATYYVGPSGNNSNSCATAQSGSTPKQTIGAGISCLSGSDTLIVKSGTYNETILDTIPSGSAGNPTIVKSEFKGGAILRPDGSQERPDGVGFVIFGWGPGHARSYVTFDGFVLDAINFGPQVYGIYLKAPDNSYQVHHITISNNEIKNTQNIDSSTASDGFVPGFYVHDILVQNNKIHDIGLGAVAGQTFYSYGAYWTCNNSTFEGNEIYNVNFGYGFHGYNSLGTASNNIIRNNYIHDVGGTGMLVAAGGANNLIYNNIIWHVGYLHGGNTGADGLFIGGAAPNGNTNGVYNNTIANASGACLYVGGAYAANNNTVQNNICYQNGNNTITVLNGSGNTIDHNNFSNPGFTNAAAGDFTLQAGSIAIDAGVTVSAVLTDRRGAARPQGAGYDLGAEEFTGSTPTPSPGTPSNLRITSVTTGVIDMVTLAWDFFPESLFGGIYNVYRQIGCTGAPVRRNPALIRAGTLSFLDTLVLPATTYCWTVRAQNSNGVESGDSNIVTYVAPAYTAGTIVLSVGLTGGPTTWTAHLTWTFANGTPITTGFNVYRIDDCALVSRTKLNGSLLATGTLVFDDVGVSNGRTHCWQVLGQAADTTEVLFSNQVLKPVPAIPSPAAILGASGGSVVMGGRR